MRDAQGRAVGAGPKDRSDSGARSSPTRPQAGTRPTANHTEDIAPYKAELEKWYHRHQGLITDLLIIGVTAWVVRNRQINPT